jgi:hypothetical protein
MSQSKKKITELHRKAAIEKSAKENMYRIAVESIKTYLRVIEKAGVLIERMKKEYGDNLQEDNFFEITALNTHKNFISEEAWRPIGFREYLERRASGKVLTFLFKKIFNESFYKRFKNKHEQIDRVIDKTIIQHDLHNLEYGRLLKEIQKFHIMQDIISETKTTEAAMLQKYNLQKNELLVIIEQLQKELKGIETQNATEPIGGQRYKILTKVLL